MPDKKLTDVTDNNVGKMTDSEIVKALEICGTYKGKCTDCPAFVKVDRSNCKKVLLGAVEIINRLQEESKNKTAEIEELKTEINMFRGYDEEIKAEVRKEFAERLKAEYADFDETHEVILPENINKTIDDILKEM